MDDLGILEEKLKAFVIYRFMIEYDIFEKKVKDYFENKLNELDSNDRNRLYFYCGGLVNKNLYIDYSKEMLCLDSHKFDKDKFKHFTIIQIIRVASSDGLGNLFEIQIDSVQKQMLTYDVKDCITKLISMRNKLAHNLASLALKDKDCIELLSNDKLNDLSRDVIYDLELREEFEQVKMILSNIIYMRKICSKLCDF